MPPTNTDTLDDIFGSSPDTPASSAPTHPTADPDPAPEPSDLPSLRRQHVTTGYREGISTSKGTHVQEGFDAGFPVGAQLGMRAGTVLGVLEGLVRGFESRGVIRKQPPLQRKSPGGVKGVGGEEEGGGDDALAMGRRVQEKREWVLRVYRDAAKELEVQSVFSGLDGDAIVAAAAASQRGNGEGEMKPQGELERKGDEVISRWEGRVNVARWEENMEALEVRDGDELGLERRTKGSS